MPKSRGRKNQKKKAKARIQKKTQIRNAKINQLKAILAKSKNEEE